MHLLIKLQQYDGTGNLDTSLTKFQRFLRGTQSSPNSRPIYNLTEVPLAVLLTQEVNAQNKFMHCLSHCNWHCMLVVSQLESHL